MKKWIETAKKNGIQYKTFINRVENLNWSLKDAATKPVNGQTPEFIKWRDIALDNGIPHDTFRVRVRKSKWDYERAATTPVKKVKLREDREWIEIAKNNGIDYDTYLRRVNDYYWTPEEAATTPVMKQDEIIKRMKESQAELIEVKHELINNDSNNLFKITKQHIELAKSNGISKNTVHSRVYNLGWTVHDAITIPVVTVYQDDPEYQRYLSVAIKNGIGKQTFHRRITRQSWDYETASEIPVRNGRVRDDEEWIEKAIKNGIKYRTYLCRVSRGWTPKEAATVKTLQRGEFLNEERKNNSKEAFKRFRMVRRHETK